MPQQPARNPALRARTRGRTFRVRFDLKTCYELERAAAVRNLAPEVLLSAIGRTVVHATSSMPCSTTNQTIRHGRSARHFRSAPDAENAYG